MMICGREFELSYVLLLTLSRHGQIGECPLCADIVEKVIFGVANEIF